MDADGFGVFGHFATGFVETAKSLLRGDRPRK